MSVLKLKARPRKRLASVQLKYSLHPLLAILFLTTAFSLIQATPRAKLSEVRERRDGNWWQSVNRSQQESYMVGFFDGMRLGRNFAAGGADTKKNCDVACVSNYADKANEFLTNITAGQLCDGLDEFYKDFRNRGILVYDAVWVVLNQIANRPQVEINRLIENLRKPQQIK